MATTAEQSGSGIRDLAARLVVAATVCVSFLAYSYAQAPIPGPNEPHYLCKAKRYWNPDFCPNDLFLDSSNAHLVFYQTIGALTLFLSLEETAFVARILGYGLLAFGWTQLISRMTRSRLAPLWTAWVFLAVVSIGNLSGEWVVGGIESKVFAYGFLLWGIAKLLDRRVIAGGLLTGLAVSFHPVVGMWGAIALGMMLGVTWITKGLREPYKETESPNLQQALIAVAMFALAAAPGLLPAIALVLEPADVDIATANRLQVFGRLAHHLDPMKMEKVEIEDYEIEAAWLAYALLFMFWLSLRSRLEQSSPERQFAWFVIATGVIAVGGVIVGWMPRGDDGLPLADAPLVELRITLMKFYAFRLFDVMLPIAAATTFVTFFEKTPSHSENIARRCRRCSALQTLGIYFGFLVFALLQPIADRNPSHMRPDEYADWLAACEWAKNNLPADAQVATPPSSWAFKWYADRAEYWSYKDCPQEAAGILEWRRREIVLYEWFTQKSTRGGYANAAVRELVEKEGITYLIEYSNIDLYELKPIYPTDPKSESRFRIYRLTDALPKRNK